MTEPYPFTSPDASLEVAQRHQDQYERIRGDGTSLNSVYDPETRRLLEHHARMVEANALLAVAGYLKELNVCGHGTRGWCPHCHTLLKNGEAPA